MLWSTVFFFWIFYFIFDVKFHNTNTNCFDTTENVLDATHGKEASSLVFKICEMISYHVSITLNYYLLYVWKLVLTFNINFFWAKIIWCFAASLGTAGQKCMNLSAVVFVGGLDSWCCSLFLVWIQFLCSFFFCYTF